MKNGTREASPDNQGLDNCGLTSLVQTFGINIFLNIISVVFRAKVSIGRVWVDSL